MSTAAPGAAKAEKFHHLQLRSVLDDPATGAGAGADETWGRLLASEHLQSHAEIVVALGLPSADEAEASLLNAVEWLAEALGSEESLKGFYKRFGWGSAEEYFSALGETQVMLVDTDHNDLDDRLAIIILAYQMASANAERRAKSPSQACTLYLDGRTYETKAGLTIWRTLRLATRLHSDLSGYGLSVEPVFTDRGRALGLVAGYLGVPAEAAALDEKGKGVSAAFKGEGAGTIRPGLTWRWPSGGGPVTVWVLSGLCAAQVADIEGGCGAAGAKFTVVEQAQPAWQSVAVAKDAEMQPAWDFPPQDAAAADKAFGAEPSNVRSGEVPYPDILSTYMSLQKAVAAAPAKFSYVCPALARDEGPLPAPPGQPMRRVAGRPLTVLPGTEYAVKRARDAARTSAAFAGLLAAAKQKRPETLHAELVSGALDDAGKERKEVAHIVKYGTFMSDAIVVALAARPLAAMGTAAVVRRLAVVKVPAAAGAGVAAEPLAEQAMVIEGSVEAEKGLCGAQTRGCFSACMART